MEIQKDVARMLRTQGLSVSRMAIQTWGDMSTHAPFEDKFAKASAIKANIFLRDVRAVFTSDAVAQQRSTLGQVGNLKPLLQILPTRRAPGIHTFGSALPSAAVWHDGVVEFLHG